MKQEIEMFNKETEAWKRGGFGRSYLEQIIKFAEEYDDEDWKTIKRWHNPDISEKGKFLWPAPKDLSIWIQNPGLPKDHYITGINMHMADPSFTVQHVKDKLLETRCN